MTSNQRALNAALSAMSGLSDPAGKSVTEELTHGLKRYAFLLVILAVAAKLF